eukprot:scaffold45381_cov37-Tisochrysis_lutea.AAC.1
MSQRSERDDSAWYLILAHDRPPDTLIDSRNLLLPGCLRLRGSLGCTCLARDCFARHLRSRTHSPRLLTASHDENVHERTLSTVVDDVSSSGRADVGSR